MDTFDVNLIPLAMLIPLIYEDKDEGLIKAANDFMAKNAKLRKSKDNKTENIYTVKAISLKHPFMIHGLKEGKVEGKDLLIKFKMNDIKILDVGDFTTRKDKKCCLTLQFEFIKVTGLYSISGSVNGNDFRGSGKAAITLRDVSSEAIVDHTFDQEDQAQINHLKFDFDFKLLEFEQTGLSIKDVPASEVRRILNAVGKIYFKRNMKIVSHKLSETIRDRFNAILKGKNRNQIAELLHQGNLKL